MCSFNHLELSSPMSSFTHPPLLSMYGYLDSTSGNMSHKFAGGLKGPRSRCHQPCMRG
jgi:hypothetical protein